MQVRGKLTAGEPEQLRSMGGYNFGLTLTNLILIMLGMTPIANSMQGIWLAFKGRPLFSLRFIFIEWLVCYSLIALLITMIIRWRNKQFEKYIGELPDFYLLTLDGLSTISTTSVNNSIPWTSMQEWWIRDELLLITRKDTLDPIVLPLADLSASDNETVRNILRENWKAESVAMT